LSAAIDVAKREPARFVKKLDTPRMPEDDDRGAD
jgi:hypothetical protein